MKGLQSTWVCRNDGKVIKLYKDYKLEFKSLMREVPKAHEMTTYKSKQDI